MLNLKSLYHVFKGVSIFFCLFILLFNLLVFYIKKALVFEGFVVQGLLLTLGEVAELSCVIVVRYDFVCWLVNFIGFYLDKDLVFLA